MSVLPTCFIALALNVSLVASNPRELTGEKNLAPVESSLLFPELGSVATAHWQLAARDLGFKTYNYVMAQHRILIGDKHHLVLLDSVSGELLFERRIDANIESFLLEGDRLIYATRLGGFMGGKQALHAISLNGTGTIWDQADGWQDSSLQINSGHIYLYTFDVLRNYTLHSFSLDGIEEWSCKTGSHAPLYFSRNLLITTPKGLKKVLLLNPTDGAVVGSIPLLAEPTKMALCGDVLYLVHRTFSKLSIPGGKIRVMALDLRTRNPLWTYEGKADDSWFPERIVGFASDGAQCLLCTNQRLLNLEVTSGKLLWAKNAEIHHEFVMANPAIHKGELLVGQSRKDHSILQVLSAENGREISRLSIDDEEISNIEITEQSILAFSHGGNIRAYPIQSPRSQGQTLHDPDNHPLNSGSACECLPFSLAVPLPRLRSVPHCGRGRLAAFVRRSNQRNLHLGNP
jgi:hypothetical protein